jgi:dTDP-4-dehydrorhamnose 3,5-epimerase
MKFTELGLPGVWLLEPVVHTDERGSFRRHFCADEFAAHGLAPEALQGNISENPQRGTLRGLHYQVGRSAEAKTLSCITGAIYDIVVDLRPDSPMFMQWISVTISSEDRRSLHVPAGCANGWMTTSPNTIIHYYMSQAYAPACARGFRYNDPAFGLQWPVEPAVISARDLAYPDFDPTSLGSP